MVMELEVIFNKAFLFLSLTTEKKIPVSALLSKRKAPSENLVFTLASEPQRQSSAENLEDHKFHCYDNFQLQQFLHNHLLLQYIEHIYYLQFYKTKFQCDKLITGTITNDKVLFISGINIIAINSFFHSSF